MLHTFLVRLGMVLFIRFATSEQQQPPHFARISSMRGMLGLILCASSVGPGVQGSMGPGDRGWVERCRQSQAIVTQKDKNIELKQWWISFWKIIFWHFGAYDLIVCAHFPQIHGPIQPHPHPHGVVGLAKLIGGGFYGVKMAMEQLGCDDWRWGWRQRREPEHDRCSNKMCV